MQVQIETANILSWLQKRENITFIIAIAGFLISIYNLLNGIFTQRRNLRFRLYGIKSYKDVTFLHIGIENKSRLSVAITHMFLMLDSGKYPCAAEPTLLCTNTLRQGNEVLSEKRTFSTAFPITIPALSAQSAYILFERMRELPSDEATHLNFEVCANRGRPMRMKLELPADWASQRKVP